jgi:hypothetical protein
MIDPTQPRQPFRLGDVFGRLTIVELPPNTHDVPALARVHCECGTERIVQRSNLRAGVTRSCGCLHREQLRERATTHGAAGANKTPEYVAWKSAKRRATCPTGQTWKYYGGRGIGMAAEWLDDFPAFLAHIGPRPGPGYSVDRIDVDGDYAPGNVRWATVLGQARNRRNSRRAA